MKSEERRAAIVRSASHLFAERGFRGATTRQLASAAGVTEIAARGLIGMISYHGLVALLFPGRFQLRQKRRIVEEMVTVFLGGITCRPDSPE